MVEKNLVTVNVEVAVDAAKAPLNYNGQPLKPGEELVATIEDPLFIKDNVTNPGSITTINKGNAHVKVVLEAVPSEWVPFRKSAVNLVVNEINGRYSMKGKESCLSLEERMESYDLDIEDPTVNIEAAYIKKEEEEAAPQMFKQHFSKLLAKSPKHAYGVLLRMIGVDGSEFSQKMKLGRDQARIIRHEAEEILRVGLSNIDISSIKASNTKNTQHYLDEANAILNNLTDLLNRI